MYIPAWSASSVDAYTTCPKKYYHLRVARDVQDFPPSDAVIAGLPAQRCSHCRA